MLDKLQAVANRFEELCARSEQPDFYNDPKKAAAILREKNDLEPVVNAYLAYRRAQQDMAEAEELMSDPEMKELCQETYAAAKEQKEQLFEKLQILLLPKDPNDDKSVIVEIRGGVGGEESALFAHSLYRMYTMYASAEGYTVELMNYSETELGGIKEADFIIIGIFGQQQDLQLLIQFLHSLLGIRIGLLTQFLHLRVAHQLLGIRHILLCPAVIPVSLYNRLKVIFLPEQLGSLFGVCVKIRLL